jgi:cephalosporin hydroxylase
MFMNNREYAVLACAFLSVGNGQADLPARPAALRGCQTPVDLVSPPKLDRPVALPVTRRTPPPGCPTAPRSWPTNLIVDGSVYMRPPAAPAGYRGFVRRLLDRPASPPDATSWTAANIGDFRPVCAEPALDEDEQRTAERFHDIYYSKLDSGRGLHTIVLSWMGYELFKCPMDLWAYQELIVTFRPEIILETGTYKGGSALYLANLCELIDHGTVVSIDIDATHAATRPQHPRITYLTGSSTGPDVLARVEAIVAGRSNVLVILDSDHRRDHVLDELRCYAGYVPVGGYLIVEDTNVNGHPTYPEFGPGPWEAVDAFLAENADFVADRTRERFILTMNPRGYLRRVG